MLANSYHLVTLFLNTGTAFIMYVLYFKVGMQIKMHSFSDFQDLKHNLKLTFIYENIMWLK